MTDVVQSTDNGLVPYKSEGVFGTYGLEDFNETDLTMPRLSIGSNNDAGYIINNLSGERYPGDPGIDMVVLGVVKQRILWPPEVGESKENPLCKSYDFEIGFPDAARFPWAAAGFQSLAPQVGTEPPPLSCADCHLKDWGTNPGASKESPWCAEQHTYIVLYGKAATPAIMVLQRSGLKGSRAYISSFAQNREPMFVCVTHLSLDVRKRGTVEYSTPTFTRGREINAQSHPEFIAKYRRIREMLRTPRVDMEDVPPAAEAPPQQVQVNIPPQAAAPVATPAPAQTAPQPAAPSPEPAPAAQAPQPAPTPTIEPPADAAPQAAAPQAVAPAPQPATNIAPGSSDDPDALPF